MAAGGRQCRTPRPGSSREQKNEPPIAVAVASSNHDGNCIGSSLSQNVAADPCNTHCRSGVLAASRLTAHHGGAGATRRPGERRQQERRVSASTPGPTPGPANLAAEASRPPATVTFLVTDVEGSTRMWERYPEAMTAVLQRHEEILRDAVAAADGTVVKETGDGVMAAFASASAALDAAIAGQRALLGEPWPDTCPIRVRMGLHSGDAQTRATDYFGRAVNRAARIMAAGHGGQILI